MKRFVFAFALLFSAGITQAQQFLQVTPAAKHWVDSTFKTLSKKEKIAQLMVLRMSEKRGNEYYFYDSLVTAAIKKYNIGAICLFQGTPAQQAAEINKLQAMAPVPLMVCIDGETGVGMRYADVAKFPDQLTIGAVSDAALAYKIGKAIGDQCKRTGIQVNYAPVVDINNNPNNPVINFRSFGEDKYKVALLGTQIMKGMQDAGVMACAKHFPGHGDVAVDSHFDLPVINKSIAQLDSLELYPFRQLVNEGVGSVMVAHLYIPAIDTTRNQATSLSKKNVTGLLRNELDFKGITFTDALEMKGVAKFYGKGEASVQSLIAGNDMLCLPGDIDGSIKQVRKAVRKGKIKKADLDEHVRKVLYAKYNLGLNKVTPVDENNLTADLNAQIAPLKKEVYENAITVLRQQSLPVATGKKVAYLGVGLKEQNKFAELLKQTYSADVFTFDYKADEATATAIVKQIQAGNYDAVVVGLHNYMKYPANNFGISKVAVSVLQQLQQQPNVINFVFGNPYALKNICDAKNAIACYEDDPLMHEVAVKLLQGKITAKGKLPVTVCDAYHYGDGLTVNSYFPVASPVSVGMDSVELNKIDAIANNAIAKGATPGCVVLVAKNGKVVFNRAYGYEDAEKTQPTTLETVYDLASVTKISATTVSIMKLWEEGKIDLKKTLGDYLPWTRGSDKAGLTLEHVLLHQAGLVSFIPFYKGTLEADGKPKPGYYATTPNDVYSVRVADNMYMRKDYLDTIYKKILDSKLGPADKYVYSDNDFIFLGKVVEAVSGQKLEDYTRSTFYLPLGMMSTTFKPREHEPLAKIAPTEKEKYFRLQQIRGDVHDPGAAMFGGVAGHAGLFSNSYDLAQLYQMLLNGGELNGKRFFKKETIDYFTAYHSNISRRGLGFDKPEKDNATRKEPYPSASVSPLTYGHTGFTGICVWADPKYDLLYIFMSNRVCPDGENPKLGQLNVRPDIQEAIYKSIINK